MPKANQPERTQHSRRHLALQELGYTYDEAKAEAVIDFIETCCFIYKGKGAGKPIILRPWQKEIIREVFGWYDADGLRVTRTLYLTLARRNGKSVFASCLACVMLLFDNEPGAEVVLAATSRDQTSICYKNVAHMVQASPLLKSRCSVLRATKRIVVSETMSELKTVSSESSSSLGNDVHCLLIDEHSFIKDRDLVDALAGSSGSRQQPLHIYFSTASNNLNGIGYATYKYAKKVANDPGSDPTFAAFIYEIPEDMAWDDPRNWSLANPALGDFRSLADLENSFRKCITVEDQLAWRMYYANQWVSVQSSRSWMDRKEWDACTDPDFDEVQLKSAPLYLGADLSQVRDITGLAAVWALPDGRFYVRTWSFLPGDNIRDKARADQVPYQDWANKGWVTLCPGKVVDYDLLEAKIEELASTYDLKCIGIDPHNAGQFALNLEKHGHLVVRVRPGPITMNEPMKFVERAILKRSVIHGGNECMGWQVGNTIAVRDRHNNICVDKDRSKNRVDAVTAMLCGFHCAIRMQPEQKQPAEFRVHTWG